MPLNSISYFTLLSTPLELFVFRLGIAEKDSMVIYVENVSYVVDFGQRRAASCRKGEGITVFKSVQGYYYYSYAEDNQS